MNLRSRYALRLSWLALVGIYGVSALAVSAWAEDEFVAHKLADLPEAITALGAATVDGQLYVYGGHTGKTHDHSIDNLSRRFQKLDLEDASAKWTDLPMSTLVQSPALVAYKGSVIRLGGMSARNAADQDADMWSLDEAEKFDLASGKWSKLPPMPEPRSSHDAVVIGDTLYVVGGWTLGGDDQEWLETAWKLDLSSPGATWEALPKQPFMRRALSAAALGNKIYVVAGLTDDGGSSCRVDVFDVASGTWSEGTALPGEDRAGFGAGACVWNGRLFATSMDGKIYRMAEDGKAWETVGELKPSRFLHRLVPTSQGIVSVAGAAPKIGHLTTVECLLPADRTASASK